MLPLSLLFLFDLTNAGKRAEVENGVWYTGKGCGTPQNEIKYLDQAPEDDSNLSCTFIWKEGVKLDSEKCKFAF